MKKTSTEIGSNLPSSNLNIRVGAIKGKVLICPVRISDCRGTNCPIADICSYDKVGKCKFEKDYLESLYFSVMDPVNGIGDKLSLSRIDSYGRKVMPLYQQLVKLQIDIWAIDRVAREGDETFGTAYKNSKGDWKSYPQHKAILECMRTIALFEKDLKLTDIWEKKHGDKPVPGSDLSELDGMFLEGYEGAYEELLDDKADDDEKDDLDEEADDGAGEPGATGEPFYCGDDVGESGVPDAAEVVEEVEGDGCPMDAVVEDGQEFYDGDGGEGGKPNGEPE